MSDEQSPDIGVVNTPTPNQEPAAHENEDPGLQLDENGRPDYAAITDELFTAQRKETVAGRELALQEAAAQEAAEAAAEQEARVQRAKGEAAQAPEATPVEEGIVSPQLAIIAKREKELRAAKAGLEAEVNRRVAQQLEAYKASIRERATKNPGQFYKEDLGVESTSELAADLFYEDLGDDAPEAFRNKRKEAQLQRKFAEMEARLEAFTKQQQQAAIDAQRDAFVGGLKAQMNSLPDTMPYLKVEYGTDPQGTLDALCQAASNMIEATGNVPTAREVAEALEEQIELIASRYSQIQKPAAQQQATPAPTSRPPVQTLNSNQTGGRADNNTGEWDKNAVIAEIVQDLQRAGRR